MALEDVRSPQLPIIVVTLTVYGSSENFLDTAVGAKTKAPHQYPLFSLFAHAVAYLCLVLVLFVCGFYWYCSRFADIAFVMALL